MVSLVNFKAVDDETRTPAAPVAWPANARLAAAAAAAPARNQSGADRVSSISIKMTSDGRPDEPEQTITRREGEEEQRRGEEVAPETEGAQAIKFPARDARDCYCCANENKLTHDPRSPSNNESKTLNESATTTTTARTSPMQIAIIHDDSSGPPARDSSELSGCGTARADEPASFTVTWRRLKFCIEPKWHERLAQSSPLVALTKRVSAPAANRTGNVDEPLEAAQVAADTAAPVAATGAASCVTRVVLDRLDGSFRSGELTAILGPSGAGKTTLLDCLTGHRKKGLSGSIRISANGNKHNCHEQPHGKLKQRHHDNHHHHQQQCEPQANKKNLSLSSVAGDGFCCCELRDEPPLAAAAAAAAVDGKQHFACCPRPALGDYSVPRSCSSSSTTSSSYPHNGTHMNGDNLKVSIIPQNDHLIGHLTVYETLNYASKMKNCHQRNFDHKLNVRRVAQQLGLMSCLSNRINKLSGGQYKRVSIAQELLSSPDILILDEPTSGLDAMTCYQTVQVLRKLTDDRQQQARESPVQKPIAVILTIHQPNSDVFQQFNHVYVVAQGGKCIYEGPPGAIESVVNRIGLRLPNSYYNPATMIVEIAAGKFGQEAICKLNSIQKKQYVEICPLVDEQNSTGDSAVDCPSSSFEEEDDDDDDDNGDDDHDDNDQFSAGDGSCCCDKSTNGPLGSQNQETHLVRLNKRFKGRHAEVNNNNNNNNNNSNSMTSCEKLGAGAGLINKAFTMESDDNNNNNNSSGVVVTMPSNEEDCEGRNSMALSCVGGNVIETKQSGLLEGNHQRHQRRNARKRRRTRRRPLAGAIEGDRTMMTTKLNGAVELTKKPKSSASSSLSQLVCAGLGGGGGGGDGGDGSGSDSGAGGRQEKRLKLNSLKADQKFPFWRHTYLHFHRSWLSIVRDPMLCSMQLALHIIVPVMVSLVYGTYVGKPNACPRAGPIDIMAYALEPTDTALQLQEDLRTTLENIGYIFFKLYGIIFAAMTVTVLTFPLDMHVLVKEFRNGWYGLASYFLGRTLADIPFQLTLPLLAMALSYYTTGQPSSYMQWRFFSITAVLILSSLIAQSQGLLFGAILMDKMKAAVFVAPAATTPIILFAGFLVRTQSIPSYLRPLSNLSYLRYAIEACLISRYGFNQCECDPTIFNQTVPELPPIARSMLDYWLSSFKPTGLHETSDSFNGSTTALDTAANDQPDLFGKLIDSLARANSFGRNITSCEQVVPYPMIDYDLKDSQLFSCFAILLAMLIFTRLLTFFIVCYKVKRKV